MRESTSNPSMPNSFANPPVTNPSISSNNNRITSAGWGYDAAGNTLSDAGAQTYVYDGENKMVKASNGGGTLGEYFYDGDGKRVKKIAANDGGTTIFVYDAAGKLVAEYSQTVASVEDAKVAYLTNDHLGSPRINTDRDGNVTARHDYHPFGEEIVTTKRTGHSDYTPDSVRKQFTGYERDNETDLDFAQARSYNFKHGRFTGVDAGPFTPADQQNFNRYAYVQNNPLKFRDPSGNKIELTGDEAQAFINYLEKKTGLKLKYSTKNGVTTITGASKDKSFTGTANKEFAKIVSKVAGASGIAKFDASSSIVNGNDKNEAVFIDDNGTAFKSATLDNNGKKTIRAGNLNMTSINSVDGQDTDLAQALVGHALIEGLDMRERGANFDLGEKGDTSAHQTGLDLERKILGQKDKRYQPPTNNPNPTVSDPISFVYTTVQYDVVIKNDGSATVNKISPPTVQRPKK